MKDVQSTLTFNYVDVNLLDIVWDDVSGLLQLAVDVAGDKFDIKTVREMLDRQELVLWVVADGTKPIAALTTRVIAYPKCYGLALDWIGGSRMKEWFSIAMPVLKDYARFQKCAHIEGYGRRAWLRWIEPEGFKQDYIAFKAEL